MKNLIHAFFFLKVGERRGLIMSLILLLFALLFRMSIPERANDEIEGMNDSTIAEIMRIMSDLEEKEQKRKSARQISDKVDPPLAPVPFDPNTVSENALLSMGIPEKIASNLCRYREAGGVFRSVASLRKIYGMNDRIWSAIEEMIVISDTLSMGNNMLQIEENTEWPNVKYEINSVEPIQLDSIRGMPLFLAERIIKYRDLLGGYIKMEQLKEVYGMDSSHYHILMDQAYIDTTQITSIKLNSVTTFGLSAHPYIEQRTAAKIIHYRDFKGHISSLSELSLNAGIPEREIEKIRPYLECNSDPDISNENID